VKCSKTNLTICLLAVLSSMSFFDAAAQQTDDGATAAQTKKAQGEVRPLASKEEMIRDRFQRFEDRVYRLRDSLQTGEPDNALRLERVLQRAGEMGIAERLEDLVKLLSDPSALTQAGDAQAKWLSDIDRILAILMERDSENEERQAEIERLEKYQEKVGKILEQQKALRDQSAQDAMRKRMSEQLGDAIKRVEALLQRQEGVSEDTNQAGKAGSSGEKKPSDADDATPAERLAKQQEALSRDTQQLAEDLKQLGTPETPQDASDPAQTEAQSAGQAAAESAKSASGAMSEASKSLEQGQPSSANQPQEKAEESLREAKEKLEEAKQKLDQQTKPEANAEPQQQLAEETESLADEMQQDAASKAEGQSPPGDPSGGQPSPPSPGQQGVEQAESEMQDASKSLGKSEAKKAKESQDRAIEQLEEAKKELEDALSQLRKEEKEETLRDLESRFREMLSAQRAINEATLRLHQTGRENFTRPDKLKLADLSAQQRELSQDAATCLHILDEDGTTIAFPRIIEQLSEDMDTVADRLADLRVDTLTQTIEREIVDTLEQLLSAVQQMQQENEQQEGGGGSKPGEGDEPLLPPSAEFKLLRASQLRVNQRTDVIENERAEEPEPVEALKKVAKRQTDCAAIAQEMRDRKQQP